MPNSSDTATLEEVLKKITAPHPCPRCRRPDVAHPGLCGECMGIDQRLALEREREREAARLARRVVAAREELPRRRQWASFEAPELLSRVRSTRAIQLARGAIDEPMVTLVGGAGTGKTSLAVCLMLSKIEAGKRTAFFVDAADLALARMQWAIGRGEAPIVERALEADVLVIDDLGAEPITSGNRTLAELVRKREANDAHTVITTGLSRQQIGEGYGGGVARRLFEAGYIDCNTRDGGSIR